MDVFTFETSDKPTVVIERANGDFRLSGWEQAQVHAETTDENTLRATADEPNNKILITADGDSTIYVPRGATVTVANVGGDAKIKQIDGSVELRNVGGDLVLRQVGATTIERVGGDLNAKKVVGSLFVRSVGGDASARSVTGDVNLRTGSDLYLREIGGNVSANAGSDAVISTTFVADQKYDIKAGSDIMCRVPADTSAQFLMHAGSEISVDVLGAKIEGNSRQKTITMGDGQAQVSLTAGSDINLTALGTDPDAMGDFGESLGPEYEVMAEEFASQIESQIEMQIETQMAELERHLAEQLAHLDMNFGPSGSGSNQERAERIAQRAREQAARSADLARRKAEAARKRAEAKIEAAQRRAERLAERATERSRRKPGAFVLKFDSGRMPQPPRPPAPPAPPAPAVSDEERMAVLKLLEQGRITVEQAEKLLSALEGHTK